MRIWPLPVCGGLLACASLLAQPASTLPRLVIEAGEIARQHAWITVQLPPGVRGADLQLRPEDGGDVLPLQIGPNREAWAVVPSIPAGKALHYRIEPALKPSGPERVGVSRDGTQLRVTVDGRPLLSYVGEPQALPGGTPEVYSRGGYIHPVFTPSGRRVTEDYPPNHRHHHGIWTAWTSTRFEGRAPDFWNMGDKKGRVEFESVGRSWSGALTGGFESRHRYVDLLASSPMTVLTEDWRVVAYAPSRASPARPMHPPSPVGFGAPSVFDLTVRQQLAGRSPLELPAYRYGGVGVRGRHEWDGRDKTFFLTSTGRSRLSGHGTRATWAHMSGDVDGRRAGIAILSHPDNVRSPQPMRIHPTEPFFNFAPQQAGAMSIAPGDTFVARYRFVAMDGEPDAALLDAMWQAYALPVRARIE